MRPTQPPPAGSCTRFYSHPALWQDVAVSGPEWLGGSFLVAWCAVQRRRLQRVAPMVRHASFRSCEPAEEGGGGPSTAEMQEVGWHLADLLHALEGAPLERLYIEAW